MCLMLTIIMVALFTTNCKKDQTSNLSLGTLQFNINSVTQNHLKSLAIDSVVCNDSLKADHVVYKLDNGPFDTITVFYIGNVPYTNDINLPSGTHVLNEFLVYSSAHFGNVLLYATPHTGSQWAGYVTTPLNHTFTITTNEDLKLPIDVICFNPNKYSNFGFTYFQLNQINITTIPIFGNFCIKNAVDYTGSDYTKQPNWNSSGFIISPAIIIVSVWRNGVLQNTFTNDDTYHHYGDQVLVSFGHHQNTTEQFNIELFILVKQGTLFQFVPFYSWNFVNNSNIPIGNNGVSTFSLGSCYDRNNPPQLILPEYINLPPAVTYTIGNTYAPGTLGAYVDATLSMVPPGYVFGNGTYPSDCADHQTTIQIGQPYIMRVYSSLYPNLLPIFAQNQVGKWNKINWSYNHENWYSNPPLRWYELQQEIWLYDNIPWNGQADGGVPALNDPNYPSRAVQMKADADANGVNYIPPTGGFAAIIFIPIGTSDTTLNANIQTMFIQINQ